MSLQYAILGLLNYSEMTGYDLKKTFDSSLNFFWSAQTSQVYRDLGNLEKLGYVVHKVIKQQDRPDKKVFKITEEGKEAFLEWLKDFPNDEITRDHMLVHLFFSASMDLETVKGQMEVYKKKQVELLNKIENNKILKNRTSEEHKRDQVFWNLCALKGKFIYEANIKWAEKVLEMLNEEV